MQFCPACDNILHMQFGTLENTSNDVDFPLTLYCKHCPYKSEIDCTNDKKDQLFNPCMYRSNYSSNHPLYYSTIVNEYTFEDPTLPCLTTPCPNEQCPCKKNGLEPKTLYVRFNDQDMRYIYLCKHCRQCWIVNNNENTVLFDFSSTSVPTTT